jgi:hypothetical protein
VHASGGNISDTDDNISDSDSSSVNDDDDGFATLLPDDFQSGTVVETMHFPGENNVSTCIHYCYVLTLHCKLYCTCLECYRITYSLALQ